MTSAAAQNPFRTSRVEAIRFRSKGPAAEELVDRVCAKPGSYALVGPHGSGKTTLLLELGDVFQKRGYRVIPFFMNHGGRQTPLSEFIAARRVSSSVIILFDGLGHLSPWRRRLLMWMAPSCGGLIATLHEPDGMPVLYETTTTPVLLDELVQELTGHSSPDQAEQLWREHSGNIREALRSLYFRHAGIAAVRS